MANISDNTTLLNETIDYYDYYDDFLSEYYKNGFFIMHVVTYIIISIGLPLLLMAIYGLFSLVKNGQVAPIYIINLLISDLIQFCCLIIQESKPEGQLINIIVGLIYRFGLMTRVGFMLCISLERYLVITYPLWYRFRRTIRIYVAVCVVVWIIPLVLSFAVLPWITWFVENIIFAIFLIIPFPLFIFFLIGTLRALSTSVSVPSDLRRRFMATFVLVLLIYTLLFLPSITFFTKTGYNYNSTEHDLSLMFLRLSPLADVLLYVFVRKETFGKLWTSVCCCRKENNDTNNTNTINLAHMQTSGYQLGGRSQKVAD